MLCCQLKFFLLDTKPRVDDNPDEFFPVKLALFGRLIRDCVVDLSVTGL